jgi:hypothetical protein
MSDEKKSFSIKVPTPPVGVTRTGYESTATYGTSEETNIPKMQGEPRDPWAVISYEIEMYQWTRGTLSAWPPWLSHTAPQFRRGERRTTHTNSVRDILPRQVGG